MRTTLRTFSWRILLLLILLSPVAIAAQTLSSFYYTFNTDGTLLEVPSASQSTSPYLWLDSGAKLVISNGTGATIRGTLPSSDPQRLIYSLKDPTNYDNGTHPQNTFRFFAKQSWQNLSAQIYINRLTDNLSNPANRHSYNGQKIFARYKDNNNYYDGELRVDGAVVIKKRLNGTFTTIAQKDGVLPGTYNTSTNYDLIPLNTWIGLKLVVTDLSPAGPTITVYTDIDRTGTWKQVLSVTDDGTRFGAPVMGSGLVGVQTDFVDAKFEDLLVSPMSAQTTFAAAPQTVSSYDSVVLNDNPTMYLTMASPASGSESDKTGHDHNGSYRGGLPSSATLPNGDIAASFNGVNQYLTVPSHSAFSISTTKQLTWEAWVRPDTFQFANASDEGYVDWMGKCQDFSPTCEWEARIYGNSTLQNRPNRFSAYVFNTSAGLGSAADWQPASNLQAGQWLHVVAEYQTSSTPSDCDASHPGTINIWVNGVKQNFAKHAPTGCMSQYGISPKASNSPLNIGTMSMDTWFKGAVGKVATYNRLLTQSEITDHYQKMTGKLPTGSCGDTCTL